LPKREALPVESIAQFKDACLAAAKLFGWDGRAQPSVTVNADKALIVCDEPRRKELIAQRQRLLTAEKPAIGAEESDRKRERCGCGIVPEL
jgi:hypothetical protein